jgi:hypothetical protein
MRAVVGYKRGCIVNFDKIARKRGTWRARFSSIRRSGDVIQHQGAIVIGYPEGMLTVGQSRGGLEKELVSDKT